MTLFRNLGPFHTTAIGHGEMPLTIENNRGHDVGIETLHASLDAGCRHIDTAWAYYTPGEEEQTGEKLVREALDTWKGPREEVTVATKVGLRRAWDGDKPIWPRDGKPEHLIEYGKQSAQALGVDSIDLLYLHRHDPEVPYNESCEGIKALLDQGVRLYLLIAVPAVAGLIIAGEVVKDLTCEGIKALLDQGVAQWAGVSNVSIEQLKIAQEILGDKLVAVQNQYSPIHLETQDTLEYCAKEGLAFVCWSPLGGYRQGRPHVRDSGRTPSRNHPRLPEGRRARTH